MTKDFIALKEIQLARCPFNKRHIEDLDALKKQKEWIDKKIREMTAK